MLQQEGAQNLIFLSDSNMLLIIAICSSQFSSFRFGAKGETTIWTAAPGNPGVNRLKF